MFHQVQAITIDKAFGTVDRIAYAHYGSIPLRVNSDDLVGCDQLYSETSAITFEHCPVIIVISKKRDLLKIKIEGLSASAETAIASPGNPTFGVCMYRL